MAPPKTPPASLALIRFALAAGVLLFGGVIWFLHRQPGWTAAQPQPMMGYAQVALSVVGVVAALVLRGRIAREPDSAQRASFTIMGWAFGEAPALLGAVIFFLTGASQWYVLGVFALFGVFALLKVPEKR